MLCLAERDGATVGEASLRALTFAASLAGAGGGVTAVVFAASGAEPDGELLADELAGAGATDVCLVSSDDLSGYAPGAWARSLEQLATAERCQLSRRSGDRPRQ